MSILIEQDGVSRLIATTNDIETESGCKPPTTVNPLLEALEADTYQLMFPSLDPEPFFYDSSMPPFRFTVSAHDPDGINVLYVTLGDSDGPPVQSGGNIQIGDASPSWVEYELVEPVFDSIYRWNIRSAGSLSNQQTALQFSFTVDDFTVSNRLLVVGLDSNGELGQTVARLLPGQGCLKPNPGE